MEWVASMGIIAVAGIITRFEWSNLSSKPKKDKLVFVVTIVLGCLLSILLVFFPDIPGPTKWFESMYKPLAKVLQ